MRLIALLALGACTGPAPTVADDTGTASDWPDPGVDWDATVSLVVDGEVFADGQPLVDTSAPAGLRDALRSWSITVTNRSDGSLALDAEPTAWIDTPGFALTGAPAVLDPQQSAALVLSYDASDLDAATVVDTAMVVPGTDVDLPLTVEVPPPLRIVIIGSGGYTLVSDSYGEAFETELPQVDGSWVMRAVTWANGRFFRAGSDSGVWDSNGVYQYSDDGLTWLDAAAPDEFWVTDCDYAFGRFLCLRSSVFSWSTTGATVIHEATDYGPMLNALTALPDRVVAVGRNGRRTWSTDGVYWTGSNDYAPADELADVVFADGLLVVAGGADRQVVSVSDDLGATWSDRELYAAQYTSLDAVAHSDGVWLMSGGGRDLWRSVDGTVSWSQVAGADHDLLGAANGVFFATSFDWNAQQTSLYRSADGVAWTFVMSPPQGIGLVDLAMEQWEAP